MGNFSYKDSRLTEVTYPRINFNDRVRKVQKNYYLNVWNVSEPILEVNGSGTSLPSAAGPYTKNLAINV